MVVTDGEEIGVWAGIGKTDAMSDDETGPNSGEIAIMAKGYWIGRVDITDAGAYKGYISANAEALAKYGAKFMVRAGAFECMEGSARARNVVIEFPSYEVALACYRSSEYQRACDIRKASAEADIIIIEGYDGPQPGDSRSS